MTNSQGKTYTGHFGLHSRRENSSPAVFDNLEKGVEMGVRVRCVLHPPQLLKLLDERPAAEEPGRKLQIEAAECPDIERPADLSAGHADLRGAVGGREVNVSVSFLRPARLGVDFCDAEVGDLERAFTSVLPGIPEPEGVSGLDVPVPPIKGQCVAKPVLKGFLDVPVDHAYAVADACALLSHPADRFEVHARVVVLERRVSQEIAVGPGEEEILAALLLVRGQQLYEVSVRCPADSLQCLDLALPVVGVL
jgi:hypothetical protein